MGRMNAVRDEVKNPLAFSFCGLSFSTPIVLLSGCVGFGEEYTRVAGFSNADAGAVVLKGTTLHARLGNSPHRVFETPAGMLNAIGLQNPGVAHVITHVLPDLDFTETRFIANVCGSTIEEYVEVTRRFDQSPIDAIEINISCPNVEHRGQVFACDPVAAAAVIEAVRGRARYDIPVFAKLSPDVTDIVAVARACVAAGADGLSMINTLLGMAIDCDTMRPVLAGVAGGLSGPAIRPVAVRCVWQVREALPDVPIIGMGGVRTGKDALELILAGAGLVAVGTTIFHDPSACERILRELDEELARRGIDRLSDVVGLAHEPRTATGRRLARNVP